MPTPPPPPRYFTREEYIALREEKVEVDEMKEEQELKKTLLKHVLGVIETRL